MSAYAFDFPETYIDEVYDLVIQTLTNARPDWKADEYSDEFESEDNILRLASQVQTQPKLLVSVTEGEDIFDSGSTLRMPTDELTVQVMVCHHNAKSTAKQKRETLRIALYVRKVLSGLQITYTDAPAAAHFLMPDGWEVDINVDILCVVTPQFKLKVPNDLDLLK